MNPVTSNHFRYAMSAELRLQYFYVCFTSQVLKPVHFNKLRLVVDCKQVGVGLEIEEVSPDHHEG